MASCLKNFHKPAHKTQTTWGMQFSGQNSYLYPPLNAGPKGVYWTSPTHARTWFGKVPCHIPETWAFSGLWVFAFALLHFQFFHVVCHQAGLYWVSASVSHISQRPPPELGHSVNLDSSLSLNSLLSVMRLTLPVLPFTSLTLSSFPSCL